MSYRNGCIVGWVMVLLILTAAVQGENWARFRGPNGQGLSREKGLPGQWTDQDYAWTAHLLGAGHSSPIVWGKTVYITSASKDRKTGYLQALSTEDGKPKWHKTFELRSPKMNTLNLPAASTPTADDEGIYLIWYHDNQTQLLSLAHDGNKRWDVNFDAAMLRHGPCTSPIVYKDLLIFTLEQNLSAGPDKNRWYGLDKRNGQIRWTVKRQDTSRGSYSTPVVYHDEKSRKDLIIFSSSQHGFTAVDPTTGAVVWEEPQALPARVVSSPILAGTLIVNGCGSGSNAKQFTAVNPTQIEKGRPKVAWTLTKKKNLPYVSTGIYVDQRLYLFHDTGPVTCLEASTGKEIWTAKPAGRFYCSPVYANGLIYCVDMKGKVVVIEAADTFKLKGIMDLNEATQASIAIGDGRMFLRTLTTLRCIAPEK